MNKSTDYLVQYLQKLLGHPEICGETKGKKTKRNKRKEKKALHC